MDQQVISNFNNPYTKVLLLLFWNDKKLISLLKSFRNIIWDSQGYPNFCYEEALTWKRFLISGIWDSTCGACSRQDYIFVHDLWTWSG